MTDITDVATVLQPVLLSVRTVSSREDLNTKVAKDAKLEHGIPSSLASFATLVFKFRSSQFLGCGHWGYTRIFVVASSWVVGAAHFDNEEGTHNE